MSGDVQPTGGYNGEQSGYTNEYGGDASGEWEDQHTSYYQQDNSPSSPYNRGMITQLVCIVFQKWLLVYCISGNFDGGKI